MRLGFKVYSASDFRFRVVRLGFRLYRAIGFRTCGFGFRVRSGNRTNFKPPWVFFPGNGDLFAAKL